MTAPLPIGPPVEGGDALAPKRRILEGRFVRLEPVDPEAHAGPLWRASHDGSEEAARMWTYLSYGPFADEAEMRTWLDGCASSEDPSFLVVVSRAGARSGW